MCVWFTLSVGISSASVVLTACETAIQQSTSTMETSTVTKMKRSFVPGEALVKFKPSLSQERIDAILKESGTELITEIKGIGVQHVRIVGKESVESVVRKLSTFQEVEYAEPNALSRTDQ
jgi:hypothetical protein